MFNMAMFFGACVGIASAIHLARPIQKVPGIYQKYLHYQTHQDDYEVLFIGTSRIYKGLIPHIFNEEVKRLTGRTVRAFNFGYDAMWPPEEFYMIRRILDLRPEKLRWVIMECLDMRIRIPGDDANTERLGHWHDWRHTALVCRGIADEKRWTGVEKWRHSAGHLSIWMQRQTNAGAGSQWLSYQFGVEKPPKDSRWKPPKEWASSAGYRPEPDEVMSGQRLSDFRDAQQEWDREVPGKPVRAVLREEWRTLAGEIRAAGAEPILMMAPSRMERRNVTGLPDDVRVFRFDDPQAHPEFFQQAVHYDNEHMNHAGAELLTRKLAAEFARLLEAKP